MRENPSPYSPISFVIKPITAPIAPPNRKYMLSLPLTLIYPFREGLYIMRTQTISFKDFMEGKNTKPSSKKQIAKALTTSATIAAVTFPKITMAATKDIDSTFDHIFNAIMNGFDAGVVLVLVFAGASWCLGHRSKAIEIIIGVACGYILARHAVDIRDFLKEI